MNKVLIVALLLVACASLIHAYSTQGKNILGPDGKPILFRGIDRPSLEWSATGESISTADFQNMASWGANIVRICMSQCFWLANTQNYQATIASAVSTIKGLKMGVILDLHWSDKGIAGGSCAQQTMADSRSITFWNQVATAYKNDPWVAFELYNEPHDISWSVWRNGGDAGGFQTPGFQALYQAVRSTGANNLVLAGGVNWAFDLSGVLANPLSGINIAYSSHPYDYGGKQLADWPAAFGTLAGTFPVVLTEFGTFNCDPTYYNTLMTYCDQLDISWTAWAWYPGGCSFPALINDWTGAPTATGLAVKNLLKTGKKIPTSGTAATITTGNPTSGTSSTTGGSGGGKMTVNQNKGSNQYWLAIDSFSGATQTTQGVQFKDSSSGASWVAGAVQTWGGWVWDAHRVIVTPVSLLLTATNGETVTINNVITNINGAQTYSTNSQYP